MASRAHPHPSTPSRWTGAARSQNLMLQIHLLQNSTRKTGAVSLRVPKKSLILVVSPWHHLQICGVASASMLEAHAKTTGATYRRGRPRETCGPAVRGGLAGSSSPCAGRGGAGGPRCAHAARAGIRDPLRLLRATANRASAARSVDSPPSSSLPRGSETNPGVGVLKKKKKKNQNND